MATTELSQFNTSTLPLLFLFLLIISTGSSASVHDVLRYYGLPGGLFPSTVESFVLNGTSGLLEVRLEGPCYARYGNSLAYFEAVVRGNLSYGSLGGVEGWAQEELFLWLPVKGILIADPSSGVILFDIGVAHKRLPVSDFDEPPECQRSQGTEEGLQQER